MSDERAISDDSVTGAVRRPAHCREQSLTIPPTYEELERTVIQWMSRCVMSRTEDARGLPLHREVELVRQYSNLEELWSSTLAGRVGITATLRVRYLTNGTRVDGLIFVVSEPPASPRRARVTDGEPDVIEFSPIGGGIGGVPNRPHQVLDDDEMLALIQDLIETAIDAATEEGANALQIQMEMAYRTLADGDRFVAWQGLVIGYADTLARMAEPLPESLDELLRYRSRARPPMPVFPEVIPQDILLDSPFFQQGYEQGYQLAMDSMHRLEELRQVDSHGDPLPFRSILLLWELKTQRSDGTRADIYRAVRDMLPDINQLP